MVIRCPDIEDMYSNSTLQYNTKFIYIVGDTNSLTLAMNSYLPTYTDRVGKDDVSGLFQ